jgi:hypothetical protein
VDAKWNYLVSKCFGRDRIPHRQVQLKMAGVRSLSGIAAMLTQAGARLYDRPPDTIAGVDPSRNFPSAAQPMRPMGNENSSPLGVPYFHGWNQTITPRADAFYTAAALRKLSSYTLSRSCIDSIKGQISQTMNWAIHLKPVPGELNAALRKREKDDENITKLSRFFEKPNGEEFWSDWSARLLDDMLCIDAPATLLRRRRKGGAVQELRYLPGDDITRYIDDNGWTPAPPSPAYCQLWNGMPRVNMTTDELVYRPRNIVIRPDSIASYLYGCSPTEGTAIEIEIGIARQLFVKAYYDKGSIPGVLQIVPFDTPSDKIREAMDWMTSELAGNLEARRQWRMMQGFNKDGKPDQVLFPKEPLLSDPFDDMHIRKIAFAYGASAHRLQKQMNRASAETGQESAEEEGLLPHQQWLEGYANWILQVNMGYTDYEFRFNSLRETDPVKQQGIDVAYVNAGIRPREEIRDDHGWDPIDLPEMKIPGQFAANGFMPITLHGPSFNEIGANARTNIPTDKSYRVDKTGDGPEDITRNVVRIVRAACHQMLDESRDRIVVTTKRHKKDDLLKVLLLIDWTEIASTLQPEFESVAVDAVRQAMTGLGMTDDRTVEAALEVARTWAAQRAGELVGLRRVGDDYFPLTTPKQAISESTATAIGRILADAEDRGIDSNELADEIRQSPWFSMARAERIAQHETLTVRSNSAIKAWQESGLVSAVKWELNPERPEEVPCDCPQIARDSPYSFEDLPDYPSHIGEMCLLSPVLVTSKARKSATVNPLSAASPEEHSIKQKIAIFLAKLADSLAFKVLMHGSVTPLSGRVNGAAHV